MDVDLKDFYRALFELSTFLQEESLNEVSQTEGRTEQEVEQRLKLTSLISSSA